MVTVAENEHAEQSSNLVETVYILNINIQGPLNKVLDILYRHLK